MNSSMKALYKYVCWMCEAEMSNAAEANEPLLSQPKCLMRWNKPKKNENITAVLLRSWQFHGTPECSVFKHSLSSGGKGGGEAAVRELVSSAKV